MRVMRLSLCKARNAEVEITAGRVGTSNANLMISPTHVSAKPVVIPAASTRGTAHMIYKLTVDVMSEEQTSQTYLTPPSPPLVIVFLRMTPISPDADVSSGEVVEAPLLELHHRFRRG